MKEERRSGIDRRKGERQKATLLASELPFQERRSGEDQRKGERRSGPDRRVFIRRASDRSKAIDDFNDHLWRKWPE